MTIKEKTTSKREFRFDIKADGDSHRLVIVNENNEELRSFPLKRLPNDTFMFSAAHGLKQKMTDDTMASKLEKFDGDRLLACDALWERLVNGQWESEREGIARPPEALVVFVIESKGIKREVALASLKRYTKEQWTAMIEKNKDAVEAIQKRLAKAKQEANGVDLTDLA